MTLSPIRPGAVSSRASFADVTERKRVETALRESEDRLSQALQASQLGTWDVDLVRRTGWHSARHDQIFGYDEPPAEWGFEFFLAHVLPADREAVEGAIHEAQLARKTWELQCRIRTATGLIRWIWVQGRGEYDAQGKPVRILGIVRDITEQQRVEQALRTDAQRMNRALRMISDCNQVLVHAAREEDLLREICNVVVDYGGYRMAWVGYAEDDAQKSVRPVAWAGFNEGYVEALNISWADTERGRGPTGQAIRTGQPATSRWMRDDPAFRPWRAEALRRGYLSSIVLPLMHDDTAFGAISIYSTNADAFDEAEEKLLVEMSEDLAYGILALRERAAREQAEELLWQANEFLEQRVTERTAELGRARESLALAQAASQSGSFDYNVITGQNEWSPSLLDLYGIAPGTFAGTFDAWLECLHPDDRAAGQAAVEAALASGNFDMEFRILRRDTGELRWMHGRGQVFNDDAGRPERFIGINTDITAHKRTGEALQASENRYRTLFASMLEGVAYCRMLFDDEGHPVDWIYLDVNDAFERITGLKAAVGKRVMEIIPGIRESNPELFTTYGRVAQTGQPEEFETEVSPLGISFHVSAFRPAPDHFVAVFEDVTERLQAEAALRKSLERFELLAATVSKLLHSHEPQAVAEGLCRGVMEHLDCDVFFNFLADPVAGKLHLNACAGISADEARRLEWLEYGEAVCGCAAQQGERIVAECIPTTPDPRTELVKGYGVKAYACHPLFGLAGEVLGTLAFGTRHRETFSADDLALMRAVSDHVAVAITRQRSEEDLRRSREDLNRAQAVAHTGSWRLDVSRDELDWSDETYRLFEIPAGQPMTYELFLAAVHPEDRAFVDAQWSAAMSGAPYEIEHRIVVNGVVKWVRERAELEFDTEGALRSGFGTVQDITARKRGEEALRASEERFRLLFETMTQGVMFADVNGRPQVANPAAEQILGATIAAMRERDYHSAEWKLLREDGSEFPREELPFAVAKRTGNPVTGVVLGIYNPALQEYRWHIDTVVPQFNASGAFCGSYSVFTDITERKRIEAALRESEQRFRGIFEEAAVGIVLVDLNGAITDVNPAFETILGYGSGEVHALTIEAITHPDDYPASQEAPPGRDHGSHRPFPYRETLSLQGRRPHPRKPDRVRHPRREREAALSDGNDRRYHAPQGSRGGAAPGEGRIPDPGREPERADLQVRPRRPVAVRQPQLLRDLRFGSRRIAERPQVVAYSTRRRPR